MKPRLPIPVSHTRCPLQVHRDTLGIIIVVSFAIGVAACAWFVVLVKGGAL